VSDAFISYTSNDRAHAESACSALEAAGLSCWIAPRDIHPGTMWADAIMDAIATSQVMVLVFSAAANGSGQVLRELDRAVARELPILPFRIENHEPSRGFALLLSTQQWLDAFTETMEVHLAQLVDGVRRLVPPRATSVEHPVNEELAAANASFLLEAAQAGDAAAATTLGLRAQERGDTGEALEWLTKGAEGEDVMAATNLGLLAKERGDQDEALTWLTEGAEGGDVMAATNLGLLAKERGDEDEAKRWLERGAEGGDQLAAEELERLDGGG
jgi:tetratricopeptide (TPR) repeat protein